MLDFLRRHHKTFWIVVTVVVIISFTFWGASYKNGSRPGYGASEEDSMVTIYGREYTIGDVRRFMRLRSMAVDCGMYDYVRTLSTVVQKLVFRDGTPMDFVANLVVLRNEMEKNGIAVSDDEAREAFRHLPAFQDKDGQFDGNAASAFLSERAGSLGFGEKDVYEMMRDYVGLEKMKQLVSGNVVGDSVLEDKFYASSYQSIRAYSIPFATDNFKKDVKVSDEEIKKYFDQNKDKFKTTAKRAVSYVFMEKPKDQAKLKEFGASVSAFATATMEKGATLESVAKDKKLEVHKEPLFSADNPPATLKEEQMVLAEIFTNDPQTHPVSDPVEGTKGYYIFSVTSQEEPKQQELKDVQAKIKETLVDQKAEEAMMKTASDMRKKLEDAVKGGKKFEEATKELNLQPQAITEFTPLEPPKQFSNGAQIAQEAENTAPASFTKPLRSEHGVIIVYVQSKVLYKSNESGDRKQRVARAVDNYAQNLMFGAWFERRRDEANATPHFRKEA